ncbi:hypothetical protein Ancab_025281 [Ancistrocladus abbreviatus]
MRTGLKKSKWEVFRKFGRMIDIYSPTKRGKWRKKFGFVGFLEVKNTPKLAEKLEGIWIGTYKLWANIALGRPQTISNEAEKNVLRVMLEDRGNQKKVRKAYAQAVMTQREDKKKGKSRSIQVESGRMISVWCSMSKRRIWTGSGAAT